MFDLGIQFYHIWGYGSGMRVFFHCGCIYAYRGGMILPIYCKEHPLELMGRL